MAFASPRRSSPISVSRPVLVLIEQEALRTEVSSTLESAGYHCKQAPSIPDAAGLLETPRFVLGISDLDLAQEEPWEFVEGLHERCPEMAIASVHASGEAASQRSHFPLSHLAGPLTPHRLLVGASAAIHHHRASRAQQSAAWLVSAVDAA